MRYKQIQIHPSIFGMWFEEGSEFHARCIKGLPQGAKLAYTYMNSSYMLNAVFEHESFELLKDGDLIPLIDYPMFEQLSCAPRVEL